ncbi:MAG: hypothetical protein RLZZ464_1682 [Pseudomonadota bacterium]
MLSISAYAAETAGIGGMVITNDTVENNNFTYPKNIHTVYFANDPSEGGIFLFYLSYKKTGTHQPSVEFTDKHGKKIDQCQFDPTTVTKLPWTHTLTCRWGGRQPDGGINFTIYNKFGGKPEKIGELFLASKNPQ